MIGQFTDEEKSLITAVLEAYESFSANSHTHSLHQEIVQRMRENMLLPNDLRRIYMYAENLAAQTVKILMDGPDEWRAESQIVNQQLYGLLLKLKQ